MFKDRQKHETLTLLQKNYRADVQIHVNSITLVRNYVIRNFGFIIIFNSKLQHLPSLTKSIWYVFL